MADTSRRNTLSRACTSTAQHHNHWQCNAQAEPLAEMLHLAQQGRGDGCKMTRLLPASMCQHATLLQDEQSLGNSGSTHLLPASMCQHAAVLQDEEGLNDAWLLSGPFLRLGPLGGLQLHLAIDPGKAASGLQHRLRAALCQLQALIMKNLKMRKAIGLQEPAAVTQTLLLAPKNARPAHIAEPFRLAMHVMAHYGGVTV